MNGFDYRTEQQAKRQRATTGVFRSSNGVVQEEFSHKLVGSSSGRFHGGTPSNALSRAAWAHNGKAPGSKPR